jgi:hypothetical protein
MSGIKVIACFYREDFLVPHFLNHYKFADTIIALVGESPDRTQALLDADPRVLSLPLNMPEGIDDVKKMDALNQVLNTPDPNHDWSIVVDSDEFIWPHDPFFPDRPDFDPEFVHQFLAQMPASSNVLMANMWQVFRHWSDTDLDTTKPPIFQRRHGMTDRDSGGREGYRKPIVIRTNSGLRLGAGNHRIDDGHLKIDPTYSFDGAHWAMADPSFIIRRTRDRRDRMSARNRAGALGSHLFNITTKGLLTELEAHTNLPQLF